MAGAGSLKRSKNCLKAQESPQNQSEADRIFKGRLQMDQKHQKLH